MAVDGGVTVDDDEAVELIAGCQVVIAADTKDEATVVAGFLGGCDRRNERDKHRDENDEDASHDDLLRGKSRAALHSVTHRPLQANQGEGSNDPFGPCREIRS